jgi:hypothetical protein
MGNIPLGTSGSNWKQGGTTIGSLSAPVSQGGSLKVVQPTAKVQQTAPRSSFQTTANPQSQYSIAPGAATSYSDNTGAGGGLSAAQIAAQQEAAQKAAEEAQKTQYRQNITGLIDQALGVYDTLFGNVGAAATSQRQALESRYNKETGSLTDQFNAELPKIGRGFAGRGTYDSSYRIEGENEAGKQFQNQLDTVKTGYETDQAKIGQELMAQQANINTGKSLLNITKSQLGQVTDLNELLATQNEINKKIVELQGAAQSTGTQEAYKAKFGELAPAADRMSTLQNQLSTIINGQAPASLKRAVAQQIVGSAGLPKDQEDQLTNIINTQIV